MPRLRSSPCLLARVSARLRHSPALASAFVVTESKKGIELDMMLGRSYQIKKDEHKKYLLTSVWRVITMEVDDGGGSGGVGEAGRVGLSQKVWFFWLRWWHGGEW